MSEKKLENKEYREYEVEVRAHILDSDFDNLIARLTDLFSKPEVTEIKTFLFRSQNGYGRIRILKDSERVILTDKIGGYRDKAREEINRDFDFDEIDDVIAELADKGLIECSYLRSTGYAFSGPGKQKLFLTRHEHLGNFLEVETLTNEQSEIDEAHCAVVKTLANLSLKELSASEYQNMMDEMYAKTLRPVSEYRKDIS